MKKLSKIIALLATLIMCIVMTLPAMAAGNNSITVTGTKEGEKLTIYKMFDLSVDSETAPTAFRYTVASNWTAFFTTGDGKDYVNIDPTDGHVTWKDGMDTEDKMIELGQKAAAAALTIGGGTSSGTLGDTGSYTFSNLEPGYYLITSTLGTKSIIDTTPVEPNPTIAEKNPVDTIDKTVKEDDGSTYGDENDVQVGDTVDFKTEVTLTPFTRNVKLYDTMTTGLSYNGDVAIAGLTAGTDYTVSAPGTDEAGNPTTFTITFTDTYLKSLEPETGKVSPATVTLTATYTATVTEAAITSGPGFATLENKTHLTFGDKQKTSEDKTTTKTYKFAINKHATGKVDLANAVFALKRNDAVQKLVKIDANNYRIATAAEVTAAGANVKTFDESKTIDQLALSNGDVTEYLITTDTGDVVVWGVDSDNNDIYKLQELKAPEGYNKLSAEVSVAVNTDNNTIVDIENRSGTELPSTGGIGTTIFYIVGSLLVIGCGIVLVSRRRMNNK